MKRYFSRNLAAHAAHDEAKAARRNSRGVESDRRLELFHEIKASNDAQIQCPHCQVRGQVHTRGRRDKEGVSGGKATAALLTAGASLIFVGLSRRKSRVHLYCRNCGMTWTA